MSQAESNRRSELGKFLRLRRTTAELPSATRPSRRRRTRGLRREEVADAAGISATWYVRLEQGRDVRASIQTLNRIGKALRLDAGEQAYLLELARPDLDWRKTVKDHQQPSRQLLAMVAGLMPHPVYVLNKYWQVKACNTAARLLFGDLDNPARYEANLVARLFLDDEMRNRFVDWHTVARSVVAQLRLSTASMVQDAVMENLIAGISRSSEEFKTLWDRAEIAEPPLWSKVLHHPRVGELHFDFAAFSPPGEDGAFTVAIQTPRDAQTANRLIRLLKAAPPKAASKRSTSTRSR